MEAKTEQAFGVLINSPKVEASTAFKLGELDPGLYNLLAQKYAREDFVAYAGLPLVQRRLNNERGFSEKAMEIAADNGRTDVMTWLKYHFRLSRRELSSVKAFYLGAVSGHADVIDWFSEQAGYDRRSLGRRLSAIFVELCGRGLTDSAAALAVDFRITSAEAQAADNAALVRAAMNGHLDTVNWLVGYFSVNRDSPGVAGAVTAARDSGHEDVARALMELLGLSEADLEAAEPDHF